MSIPAQGAVGAGTMTAAETVTILYQNYRGETAVRRITPIAREWFGSSDWHPEPQWLFTAFDMDKEVFRDFARAGVKAWGQAAVDAALASPRADSDERTAGEKPWGIEEADGRIWVGPLARDGTKVDAFVFEMDIRDLGPEAQERSRADARRVVNAINTTPAQPAWAVPDSLRALSEAVREYGKAEWSAGYATGSYGEGPNPDVTDRLSNVLNSLSLLLASHPAGQSAGSGAEEPWGIQEDGGFLWVGPLREDGTVDLVFQMDIRDIGPSAQEGARANARRIVAAVNAAPDSTRAGQGEETVAVPASALRWLFGDGPDADGVWFGDQIRGNGAFWWRSEFRKRIEAARPAAPEAQGAWSFDMEAAPRDGTSVLVAGPSLTDPTVPFVGEAYVDADNGGHWWWAGTSYGDYHAAPLHEVGFKPYAWHPMLDAPAPPASSGQGGR